MKATLLPLRSVIEVLDDELASADDQFAAMVANDVMVKRLMTLPSIGPITATAFVAALDDVSRFTGAAQVTSYLGLVPREYSSGEQQYRGRILRSAHPHVQSLLVQAAWRLVAIVLCGHGRSARVGAGDYSPTRKEGRDGRPRSTPCPHSLCDVAGRVRVSRESDSRHAVRSGGDHQSRGQGGHRRAVAQRGSSSWRSKRACGAWPLLRAVPQRALLLLRISIVRRHRRATQRARIKG